MEILNLGEDMIRRQCERTMSYCPSVKCQARTRIVHYVHAPPRVHVVTRCAHVNTWAEIIFKLQIGKTKKHTEYRRCIQPIYI